MGDIKLIESVEDNYTFGRAWIAEQDGALVPRALFGGVLVNIETMPGPLQDGLAWCEPVDGTPEENWPVHVRVEIDGEERTLWKMTGNARIVEAARKFAQLMEAGRAAEGMEL